MKTALFTVLAAVLAIAVAGSVIGTASGYGHTGDDHAGHGQKSRGGHKASTLRSAKLAKSAYLNGRAEIGDDRRGAGDPDASATAVCQLVDDQTICYGFTLDNTDTPTIVHIHRGAANENGAPVIEFANVPKNAAGQPSGDPGTSSGCKTVSTPAELAALKQIRNNPRGFYVNMHTQAYPKGAVRGQLSHLRFSNR
jgi:hypothetical protein